MKRDFYKWLDTFTDSMATWGYYTDFEKVYENVKSKKVELNILNSLIGSKDIEKEFRDIVKEYPKVLKCISILIAKREKDKVLIKTSKQDYNFDFKNPNYSIDEYVMFMEKNGLFDLLQNHLINNIYDYVTGVEVGLDTNARKNRTGTAMENFVEGYLIDAGLIKDKTYCSQITVSEIKKKWGFDLSNVTNDGEGEKRFDFAVKVSKTLYVIEVNFYASSGSKLNETARSYKTIAKEIDEIDDVVFVWFTDGVGWNSAKNNLKETYDVLDTIYNIKELKEGIAKKIFK